MATELEELKQLMTSSNPKMINYTCEYFSGLSGSLEGLNFIISQDFVFTNLMKFCTHEDVEICLLSLKTIINCLQNENGVYFFISCDKAHFCTEALFDRIVKKYYDTSKSRVIKNSLLLVENLSRINAGARHVFELLEKREDLFEKMMTAFQSNDEIHHDISLVFGNICQMSSARKLFLDNDGSNMLKLVPFLNHEDVSCRLGVANLLKNCCFDTDYHAWLLKDDTVLSYILLPLAGPEELDEDENENLPIDLQYLPDDKVRETVNDVILSLVQAVHKLCSTKFGRENLRKWNVYVILRELFASIRENEGCEKLTEEVHNVIQILIGDEEEEGGLKYDNLQSVEVPEHIQKELEETTDSTTTESKTT